MGRWIIIYLYADRQGKTKMIRNNLTFIYLYNPGFISYPLINKPL